ncbi:MAG: c-type cytochrome [Pseudomonadota bacterium]
MLQSMLRTATPQAESLAGLWWLMFWVCLAVFAVVMALMAAGLIGGRRPAGTERAIAIGTGLTAAVLAGLLVTSSLVGARVSAPGDGDPLRIEVFGRLWWWEVRYPGTGAVLANEIRLPAGRPAEIALVSDNVIHSFWVPGLAGKLDMVPGHSNLLRVTPAELGVYRGQCAEFCGTQHALMAFVVVVQPPAEFARWLAVQAEPAAEPADAQAARGQALFLASGCGACHTVRGIPADGRVGPDLTHVGSRLTIGAGILPQNVGTLGGWVANSQAIKPGNAMPAFDHFSGEQLRAIAAWLAGLE